MKYHLMIACLCVLPVGLSALSARPGGAETLQSPLNQSPPQSEDVSMLTAEAPIERELSGGQIHSYQIALSAGDYLRIVITSRGNVLKPELFAPDSLKAVG